MEKSQTQLPYQSPVFPASQSSTLFLGILEVTTPAKKRVAPKAKKVALPPLPLPGRRVTFLDISPKPKV